jgi:hypothetical protein
MRTTLNIDDDVSAELSARSRRESRSLSRVVNDLLRAGLRAVHDEPAPEPYDPPIFDTGRPFVDVTDVAAALEVLERDA